jgi:threonine/homoserine/homoserine lactone efflux protein
MLDLLDLPPVALAALTGFISGVILCIPVGPINLTIMNEGTRRGFKWACMIGIGATLMEVIYCAIAFTGFASFFQKGAIKAAMELFSFVFMFFLGVKFLVARSLMKAPKIEERIEEKLHPHSAFWIGFVRVMGNPGVLVGWIIFAASFISRGWVRPNGPGKLACIGGVALSIGLWFTGLSWICSRGHGKLSEQTLLRLERGAGVCLLALALVHAVRIIWQMSHHQI